MVGGEIDRTHNARMLLVVNQDCRDEEGSLGCFHLSDQYAAAYHPDRLDFNRCAPTGQRYAPAVLGWHVMRMVMTCR